jgi:hypothetical protein
MGLSTRETDAAEGPGAVRSDAAVAEIYHGRCRLFLFEVTVPVQCEHLSELKPEPERFAVTRENVQQRDTDRNASPQSVEIALHGRASLRALVVVARQSTRVTRPEKRFHAEC